MTSRLLIQKLGGSVLTGPEALPRIALAIAHTRSAGRNLVIVTSAFAGVTDRLADAALRASPPLLEHDLASALAAGEAEAVARLSATLRDQETPHAVLTTRTLGLITVGPALDAEPARLDDTHLRAALHAFGLVIVPGFVGCTASGLCTLLGRGGSDTTAIFLAHALDAEVHLIKDEPGLFPQDPKFQPKGRHPLAELSFEAALALSAKALQGKALRWAKRTNTPFLVTDLAGSPGTWVRASSSLAGFRRPS